MKILSLLAPFGPLILGSAFLALASNPVLADNRLAPALVPQALLQDTKLASNVDPLYLQGVRAKRFVGLTELKKSLQANFGVRVKRVLAITVITVNNREALELSIEDRGGNIYTLVVDAVTGQATNP